jgi:hypothetical protein
LPPLRRVKGNGQASTSGALWRQAQVLAGVDVEEVGALHIDPELSALSL